MYKGYIPTANLLSFFGLNQFTDPSFESMKIESFNLVGSPYPIKGISQLTLQNTPDVLRDAETEGNYGEKTGMGLTRTTLHYVNTTTRPLDLEFIATDTFEGPPHATTDYSGNLVMKDFLNLFEVSAWLKMLAMPVPEWRKPPYVRVSYGRWSKFGVVYSIHEPTWLSFYPNGEAKIARFGLTLKEDIIVVTPDTSFFEVD